MGGEMKAYYEALALSSSHFPSTRVLASRLPPPARKRRRRIPSFLYRTALLLFFFLLLYQEFYIYKTLNGSWLIPKKGTGGGERLTRFLLVADPQLIGYQNEPPFLGLFTRWDSDRYLGRCYREAVRVVEPDGVIFLGDLLDEGSIASPSEFHASLQRFNALYPHSSSTPSIFISGDNDVGGEGSEKVNPNLVLRFSQSFPSQEGPDGFCFVAGNVFDGSIYNMTSHSEESQLKILLSHHPILTARPLSADSILDQVRPNLVLSAHSHVTRIIESRSPFDRKKRRLQVFQLKTGSKPFSGDIPEGSDEFLTELQVPTCSYRMGVPEMGFGILEIRNPSDGGRVYQFSILWLPDRYFQLYVYLAFGAICGVLFFLIRCI